MSFAKVGSSLPLIFLLSGCGLTSLQYPHYPPPQGGVASGAQSSGLPQAVTHPQTQMTASQRAQHAWQRGIEGMMLGGYIGGPYGAGGGLIIGLLAGLFTAEAHYTHLNTQIQLENAKDKQLEAEIEREIARQRELEAQVLNSGGTPTGQNQAGPPQPAQEPTGPNVTTVAMKEASSTVASLSKKEAPSNSPSRPFNNVEIRDINGDGVPDLWIYYNPLKPNEIVRQEEATRWDGRVDTWSYFQGGNLMRREVDTKVRGTADTVYYYENDKIIREERDENSTGHVSFRAVCENGRRAKVEEDTNGQGKTDRWTYYDTTRDGEIVLKEERDLNSDGAIDLWSYYENGRLVRRDVSAVGLELMSKQDQIPFPKSAR